MFVYPYQHIAYAQNPQQLEAVGKHFYAAASGSAPQKKTILVSVPDSGGAIEEYSSEIDASETNAQFHSIVSEQSTESASQIDDFDSNIYGINHVRVAFPYGEANNSAFGGERIFSKIDNIENSTISENDIDVDNEELRHMIQNSMDKMENSLSMRVASSVFFISSTVFILSVFLSFSLIIFPSKIFGNIILFSATISAFIAASSLNIVPYIRRRRLV